MRPSASSGHISRSGSSDPNWDYQNLTVPLGVIVVVMGGRQLVEFVPGLSGFGEPQDARDGGRSQACSTMLGRHPGGGGVQRTPLAPSSRYRHTFRDRSPAGELGTLRNPFRDTLAHGCLRRQQVGSIK